MTQSREESLLAQWKLSQYWNVMDQLGYDDCDEWSDLTQDELEDMGFKPGHAKKFIKKVKESFGGNHGQARQQKHNQIANINYNAPRNNNNNNNNNNKKGNNVNNTNNRMRRRSSNCWNCDICTFENRFNHDICQMCYQGNRPQFVKCKYCQKNIIKSELDDHNQEHRMEQLRLERKAQAEAQARARRAQAQAQEQQRQRLQQQQQQQQRQQAQQRQLQLQQRRQAQQRQQRQQNDDDEEDEKKQGQLRMVRVQRGGAQAQRQRQAQAQGHGRTDSEQKVATFIGLLAASALGFEFATQKNCDEAVEKLESKKCSEQTALRDAIVLGIHRIIKLKEKLEAIDVLDDYKFINIVLTDGEDTKSEGSRLDFFAFQRMLAAANFGQLCKMVFVGVGLSEKAEKELKLYGALGGDNAEFRTCDDTSDIEGIFQHISLNIIRNTRIIGIRNNNTGQMAVAASQNHELEMKVNNFIVLLTLDISGSMAGGRWRAVKKASKKLLDNLKSSDMFGIILFNNKVEMITG